MANLTNILKKPLISFSIGAAVGGLVGGLIVGLSIYSIFYFREDKSLPKKIYVSESKSLPEKRYFGSRYSCVVESITPNFSFKNEITLLEPQFDSWIKSGKIHFDGKGNFDVKYNNRFIVDLKCKRNKL